MKIQSKAAPKPTFEPIQITITVESHAEMKALEQLCRISQERDQRFYPQLTQLATDLLPHVTAC